MTDEPLPLPEPGKPDPLAPKIPEGFLEGLKKTIFPAGCVTATRRVMFWRLLRQAQSFLPHLHQGLGVQNHSRRQ